MKFVIISSFFILTTISNLICFSQNTVVNIDSFPELEKAEALLNLAKSNYTSNYDLADDYSTKALLIAEKLGQKKELGIANKYLGITDYFRRNYVDALYHYNKSMVLFDEMGETKELANVINNIALIHSESGDYDLAIEYHKKSLKIREEQSDAEGIIGSLINIGNLYQNQDDYAKSLEYYQKALEISKLVFPEKSFINLIGSLAKSHAKLGNTQKALQYFMDAIDESKNDNNTRSIIANQINLGNFYFDLGSTEKAISYFTEALILASDNNMNYLKGVAYLNIGNTYYQDNNYSKASELYNSSLIVYRKTNDVEGQIRGLINIALCLENLGSQDSAGRCFLEARNLSEQFEKPGLLAMTANYLGKHHLNSNNQKEAILWLNKAFELADKNDINRELYMSNYNLGNYWYKLSDYTRSLNSYEAAFENASNMESVVFQKDAMEGIWKSFEGLQNYRSAHEALKEYGLLKDSIFNTQKQKQIIAIEGKLNLVLKENQIISQNKIINQQEKILKQEKWNKVYIISVAVLLIVLLIIIINRAKIRRQKEKAELIQQNLTVEHDLLQLQMNPHFIFNALNSIQSFISENNSFEAELFLSKFAHLMRYYLDSSSASWVNFTDELKATELNLEIEKLRLNNKFQFNVIVDENIETEEIQLPPMILQPFIENAVKHGLRPKKTNGQLEIRFTLEKDNMYCYIQDDGIGREAAGKTKKVSSGHKSKGIELTRKRLMALFPKKSTNEFFVINDLQDENGLSTGTRVELIIPIRYF
ncbi:MAG: tetratricopeptide repeat protein [Bacteroidetes bacterium]|nr:tetratricopeptide repeat protein [Bacteroidota bacterium]